MDALRRAQLVGIVPGHPEEIGICGVTRFERLWIGPADMNGRRQAVLESRPPQETFNDQQGDRDAEDRENQTCGNTHGQAARRLQRRRRLHQKSVYMNGATPGTSPTIKSTGTSSSTLTNGISPP